MKKIILNLCSVLIVCTSFSGMSQTSIQTAFKNIINCPQAKITESHKLEKDPATKVKTGQYDVYNFVLPANKINLINKAFEAFDKDSPLSYSLNRGNATWTNPSISVAVGDGSQNSERINDPGTEYIYMLFLAPPSEDPNGIYRYAYAMNYKEDGKNIVGKLVITYATTLKYRQEKEKNKQTSKNLSYQRIVTSPDGKVVVTSSDSDKDSWFDVLMTYLQGITATKTNDATKVNLASRAYKHITNKGAYSDVSEADILTAQEVLKVCLSEMKNSDPMLNTLLKRCLAELK